MIETGCIIILLLLGAVYAVICMFLNSVDSDFDKVLEARCKKCVYYPVCGRHGCDYSCKEFMTEEMMKRKGIDK